jgi:two-component system chemotaxis response regulator CheY
LRCTLIVNVFIVEDDHSLRLLYEKALKLNGYNIVGSAKDGEEAVNMYNHFLTKPDIILMDHRMPIKNGIEATKEILQNSSDIKPKIIFVSADRSIRETALSIGVISFKNKPFSLERLFNNIEKAASIEKIEIHG